MNVHVIGLAGRAGAGKSTAAGFIEEVARARGWRVRRRAFAEPVKAIARREFGWNGAKDARGRRLLQVIGTEAGRAYDPEIWVRRAAAEVEREARREEFSAQQSGPILFVFDDVRFDNEADFCRWTRVGQRELGTDFAGEVWLVEGRASDLGGAAAHASEAGVWPVDRALDNSGSPGGLRSRVAREFAAFADLFGGARHV